MLLAHSLSIAALLWPGRGNARILTSVDMVKSPSAPTLPRKDEQRFVWRGDSRDNDTIWRAGGFRPRGDYVDDEEAYDLERHKQGATAWKEEKRGSKESSAESCTPSEMGWASAYAATTASSRTVSRLPWVYLIRGTPNMIDAAVALGDDDAEDEFAALGGVLWAQVVGHMTRDTLQALEVEYADGIPDDVAVESVLPNLQYDAERFRYSSALRSLAEGYGRGSRQAATAFMGRPGVGQTVGWTGQFPLLPVDPPCPSSLSSRESGGGDGDETTLGPQQAAFTEEDMLAAVEYLREHDEPCEPGEGTLHSYLVMEAEDAIATSLERLDREEPGPFSHHHGIAEADAFIQRAMDMMRRGGSGVCNLLGGCEMLGTFDLHKRANGEITFLDKQEGPNRGFASFCGKIRQKPRTDSCQHVQDVEFGFKLSDDFLSGTYDRLGAILQGPSGRVIFEIADGAPPGYQRWTRLDLEQSFGSNTLDVAEGITQIQLTAAGHYEGTKNDEWKLQDMVLRARCVESGYRVEVDKFRALNTVYKHQSTGLLSDQLVAQTVATFDIAPTDWHMRPACSYVTELKYHFRLSADFHSGTYDAIVLNIGTRDSFSVANEPSPGFSVSKDIDLKKAFGTDEVAVRHLKWVSLIDLPSKGYFTRDAWKLRDLVFTAKCAASPKMMVMNKFQSINKWLRHGPGFQPENVWSAEISPQDWREVSS